MVTAPYEYLLEAKKRKNVTFEQIGKAIGRDEVWVAALLYGQAKPTAQDIQKLNEYLEIQEVSAVSELASEQWFPIRGDTGPIPPTDPVIYRLYEGILVYGTPIKQIIHEKFGDGIMSMIDCFIKVERKPDPKGDRVVLTFDGKFLPYAKW